MGQVVPFEQGRPPAIFASRQSTLNAAAQANVQASFAVIGYKGRNWRIKHRGEEDLLKNDQGVPFPHLEVIIVGVSPAISKIWYEKRYTEGSDEAPDCFSVDGVWPDAASLKKQSVTCATCPRNVWGSRTTEDGKKAKACQDSRRVAVVPLGDPVNEMYGGPMLLRVPPMSLNNLASYAAMLERKGAGLEFVATKLGFDYDVAYPRITFEALGWLSEEQAQIVVGPDGNSGICGDTLVSRMLMDTASEAAPVSQEQVDSLAAAPPAALAQRQAATPAAAQPIAAVEQPAPAAAPPPRRASAFQTGLAAAPTPAAPAAPPVPPAVAAQPVQVQEAPADMLSVIDDLLRSPTSAA